MFQSQLRKVATDLQSDRNATHHNVSASQPDDDAYFARVLARTRNAESFLYNRVPHCASTVVNKVLNFTSKRLGNAFVFHTSGINQELRPTREKLEQYVEVIDGFREPWVFSRNLHFVNFTDYGRKNPVYVNFIRKPIDRFLSAYDSQRLESAHATESMNASRRQMSLSECVYSNASECTVEGAFQHGAVPYFCGQSELCMKPTQETLELAKQNVKTYYSVVGITDDLLGGFLALLEQTSPDDVPKSHCVSIGVDLKNH